MRTILCVLLLAAASVLAQFDGLPNCADDCADHAISVSGCRSRVDLECLCTSESFSSETEQCAVHACTITEQSIVRALLDRLCAAATTSSGSQTESSTSSESEAPSTTATTPTTTRAATTTRNTVTAGTTTFTSTAPDTTVTRTSVHTSVISENPTSASEEGNQNSPTATRTATSTLTSHATITGAAEASSSPKTSASSTSTVKMTITSGVSSARGAASPTGADFDGALLSIGGRAVAPIISVLVIFLLYDL
ncbi:uncharacterized protein SCHCODRAFT_02613376 [Schizophyllum commune H4-8]|uniref:uncharacterized protein n=1 Tax=Schizophyllum commune (strain H4-8 / FGSC 9210) TaxID=578458 RepID=UPI00215F4C67|nr:uncharacterized protein SCHCODRAFT_02613376 [Schizophyllum commune H4-8]KAI5898863.1 hypothetical protein SCHCODRAFT_02613376 [Schizophyllum commune H4-8]